MKLLLCLLLLSLAMVSCSGNKKSQDVDENPAGIDLSDSEGEEGFDDDSDDPLLAEEDEGLDEGGDELADAGDDLAEDPMMDEPVPSAPMVDTSGGGQGENFYTVQRNETLMLIAFKLFGDYEKWRELARWNSGQLNGSTNISVGMQLKYMRSGPEFVWNPEGNPYLIKRGETLGIISDNVYQTPRHWRDIWQNNKPLIKDPNVIFAGFTIYTPILDGRGVANN
ncbi:LysM peptidoglycan-binding domain-containing protein [Bacteriovoracaceae bacterium]|nr:LysM peptidoglycan-binding domain-containing protein [Bacteriovoracaceae bacterium]